MTSPKQGGGDLWYDYETEPPPPTPSLKRRIRKAGLLAVAAASVGAVLAMLVEMSR